MNVFFQFYVATANFMAIACFFCSVYVLQTFGESLAKALAKVSLSLKFHGEPFVRVSELADATATE